MSISSEITRIQTAKNTLRAKAVNLGIGLSTDNLSELATKYNAIVDRGTPQASIVEGETYTIEAGYYHGGTVQAQSDGGSYQLQSKTITPTKSTQNIASDDGYYGLSSVTVNPIPDIYQDVSGVTAGVDDVLANKIFVNALGEVKTGEMVNNGAVSLTMDGTTTTSVTVPKGYHSGLGKVTLDNTIETALAAI